MEKKLDLRLQKTYQALHDAFTQLLEEKRFEELTVGELCDRAVIRRTTFYKHFADKYDYFGFYIREMASTLQHQVPQNPAEISASFLYISRELLSFLQTHARIVYNIKNSSMFPLLLSILLYQFTGDIISILQQLHPDRSPGAQEGIAAFYAGGIISTYFRLVREDSTIDEDLFLDIVQQATKQMLG